VVWKENRGVQPRDIVVFGEKSRGKSGKKWPFLTPVFWPFHRCETGKRGYGVKFQVSQIKNGWPFLIESIKNRNGYM
jgi:hypothetical protein